MGLIINQELVNDESGRQLEELCPFKAISYSDGKLDISSACRLCKVCVRSGPQGVVTYQEEETAKINKDEYKGVCVYADSDHGLIHNVTFELIGKAKELASVISHPARKSLTFFIIKSLLLTSVPKKCIIRAITELSVRL